MPPCPSIQSLRTRRRGKHVNQDELDTRARSQTGLPVAEHGSVRSRRQCDPLRPGSREWSPPCPRVRCTASRRHCPREAPTRAAMEQAGLDTPHARSCRPRHARPGSLPRSSHTPDHRRGRCLLRFHKRSLGRCIGPHPRQTACVDASPGRIHRASEYAAGYTRNQYAARLEELRPLSAHVFAAWRVVDRRPLQPIIEAQLCRTRPKPRPSRRR